MYKGSTQIHTILHHYQDKQYVRKIFMCDTSYSNFLVIRIMGGVHVILFLLIFSSKPVIYLICVDGCYYYLMYNIYVMYKKLKKIK